MKFGYFVSFPRRDGTQSWPEVYRDGCEQIEYADSAGFDDIWFPEHHLIDTLTSPAPLLSVVDAARRTRHARLGTVVILSPFYHPLIVAEQIALADHLTEGRLEVAFGRGSYNYEYSRLGMTEAEASARQRELLEILLGVWARDEEFAYQGEYYAFPPSYPVPRPRQQPHPRLGVAGRTPETLRFVIEHGLDLHTTPLQQPMSRVYASLNLLDAILAELGRSERPQVSCQREVFVSADPNEVREAMRYLSYTHAAGWHFHQGTARVRKAHTEHQPLPEGLAVTEAELAERSVVGEPETCVRKLREYEELGFDEFIVFSDFGQPQGLVMRSMRQFAEHVMPHFRRAEGMSARRRTPTLAAGGPRRPATQAKQALFEWAERTFGAGWQDWEAPQWLGHFARARTSGDGRNFYVFDFGVAPRVRGDAGGFVVEGELVLLRDEACPECGRPVVALYRRWEPETMEEMRVRVNNRMRELDWHALHP